MARHYWVYMLASRPRGALYIGMTNALARRLWEHRAGLVSGHVARYGIHRLVWMADFEDPEEAIATEKRMKRWRRSWKIELVESVNPEWRDLLPGEAEV